MVKYKLHTIRKNTDSNCTVSIKDVTFTIILRAVASRPSITPVALTYSYINIIYNTILFTTIVILHNRPARPSSTMLPEISLICLWTLGYDNPVGRSPPAVRVSRSSGRRGVWGRGRAGDVIARGRARRRPASAGCEGCAGRAGGAAGVSGAPGTTGRSTAARSACLRRRAGSACRAGTTQWPEAAAR